MENREYILKNIEFLSLIEGDTLSRWKIVWRWSNSIVTRIWTTQEGVSIVLKESSLWSQELSFSYELALLNLIYEKLPEYQWMLPKFYWVLRTIRWKFIWIITDGFEENNSNEVESNSDILSELEKALCRIGLVYSDSEYIRTSIFQVWNFYRLGDLWLMTHPLLDIDNKITNPLLETKNWIRKIQAESEVLYSVYVNQIRKCKLKR